MNFLELAKKRYSVRNYTNQKVEKDKLDLILEAGRIAPTAANRQPQRLLVIESQEGLLKLQKAADVHGAPLAVVIFGDKKSVWKRPQDGKITIDIDASIVTDHLMHEATGLGLATLWMTWFDPKIINKEFNVPKDYEPVNILLIGYSSGNALSPDRHNTTRKALKETVFYESFS
jgi:nitroreductase